MSLDRFEKELRDAAPKDAPSAERKAANRAMIIAAAGLVAPPLGAAMATKTALLLKIALASAIGVGVAVAVVVVTRPPPPSPAPPSSAVVVEPRAVVEPGAVVEPRVVVEPPPIETASASPLAARASAGAPPVVASPASASTPDDPLALEAKLLEAARTCSQASDLTCASAKLADYDRRFPHGALADEATLLHIDVARARGDLPEARRLAQALLAAHPSGAYAKRARAILAELGE